MHINNVKIKNFRLLKEVELSLEQKTTVIVGRNNSGKTSFTELFRRLFSDNTPKFNLEDFPLSVHEKFWDAFLLLHEQKEEHEIRKLLPSIEVTLSINYAEDTGELGPLSDFIIDMDITSTSAILNIQYRLTDGMISMLFDNIPYSANPENILQEKKIFFRVMKERIPQLYAAFLSAVDPTDYTNQKNLEISKLKTLLQTGFINAQRGLDDTTHRDKDVLGKVVERMLNIAKQETSLPDDIVTASALEKAVQEIQVKLDSDFNEQLNKLLPALSLFGYPGLNNTPLHTETILDVQRLLENHTKVRYSGMNGISLPETYNGLGTRNLIFILLQLFEFFKSYKARKTTPGIHVVFIEEPEAHLHPQMQEVFIRKINEIADDFSTRFNGGIPWPIQFVITTHSTHMANEAPFVAIRYFLSTNSGESYTRVKDLRYGFSGVALDEDKEFLHKYLTLTRCDLFFADKAILIEGPTERLLMPKILEKADVGKQPEETLSSKYLSIVEVGGAYAHHFFTFLNFLELRTLIITDIDSVHQQNNGTRTTYPKCLVSEGTHTSNACIKKWFGNNTISPSMLLLKSSEEKTHGILRIAFQVPENSHTVIDHIAITSQQASTTSSLVTSNVEVTEFEKNPEVNEITKLLHESIDLLGPCGRSFEDAFMLANKTIFDISGNTSLELATNAWEKARNVDKTNFALEYAINKTDWNIPLYIKDGLSWLAESPEEQQVTDCQEIASEEVLIDE